MFPESHARNRCLPGSGWDQEPGFLKYDWAILPFILGQNIATFIRRLVTPKGSDCKGIPSKSPKKSGLGIIVSCPDFTGPTWRIIPVSKELAKQLDATMVIVSPQDLRLFLLQMAELHGL